jgi:hypothetical protein
MKTGILVAALLLAGAAIADTTPRVIERTVDGVTFTEVWNPAVWPCGDEGVACYVKAGDQHVIYRRFSISDNDPTHHEVAHAKGMRHGPWGWNFWRTEKCAVVTAASPGYPLGATICVDHRRERVF